MAEGKTSTGFAYVVDEDVNDDMELLEGFIALDNGDMTSLPQCITSLLGAEQKKALYESIRDENGRVRVDAVEEAINEIMTAVSEDAEGKNS